MDRLAQAQVQNVSLTDLDTVAQVAAEEGYIRPEDQKRLLAFRAQPLGRELDPEVIEEPSAPWRRRRQKGVVSL